MPREVRPIPLTHTSFSAFGDVIDANGEAEELIINDGHTVRHNDLAKLDLTREGGRAAVSIFRSTPPALPIVIRAMERHPLSSQAFVPLGTSPWLVVVAPAGDLEAENISIFVARPGQGVNYHPGVWHHYNLVLFDASDFLVIDRLGTDTNCEEINLPEADWIEVDLEGII